ncbi:MAG: TIGR04190 family B12-binding domain/radical SAM domain protein [Dehalococcoidia bacterium]|nr:TIGR04190 family B12-binding domain/radical SAM domain protein [Dehalococcoidia bacterium]
MPKPDLILLHAPSVYDFRNVPQLYGPASDLVISTPAFEMYPIGFSSIVEHLEQSGCHVRLVNLALRMLRSARFDAEKFIAGLNAPVFGIDLHWLVHAHGAIEVAKLVRKHHPKAKIIMGGFSASYFHRELINYPEVDFVMRGDSTEELMLRLVRAVTKGDAVGNIPNLIWKDASGIHDNGLTHVPDNISNVMQNHYLAVARSVLRFFDFTSTIPVKEWLNYPVTAVLTCKGCENDCVFCGGARSAVRRTVGRERTAFRTAQDIFNDIKNISKISRGPIFVLSDIRMGGEERAYELLRLLKRHPVRNTIDFELFTPPTPAFIEAIADAKPGFAIDISPHSHDINVRRAMGLDYTNEELETGISAALAAGASRFEVYFMIGLPEQTPESVEETLDYCDYLYRKFHADKRLLLFIGPLSPFLDPGSPGFEDPEKYGYRLIHRTLEEHRNALVRPTWGETLNYETKWMSRAQIVESTYTAIERLMGLKQQYGLVSQRQADRQTDRIRKVREMEKHISEIVKSGSDDGRLAALKPEIDLINGVKSLDRRQIKVPMGLTRLRYLSTLVEMIKKWKLLEGK